MIKKIMMTLLLVGSLIPAMAKDKSADGLAVGDKMPSFTIELDNGKKISSSKFDGKVRLVTLFATWCPPCLKELPHIQKQIWNKYKNNPNFELMVFGREHSEAEVQAFATKRGFTFPIYPDKTRGIYSLFAKNTIPRNYLIDKNGVVVYTSIGFNDADFDQLLTKLAQLLD